MAIITLNNRSINRSDTASADQVWTATSATASDFQAGGIILQVVQATTVSSSSTTSSSFVATALSVDITPTSSSNKIFVSASTPMHGNSNGWDFWATIYRDGTTNLGSSTGLATAFGNATTANNASMIYLDSPSTTSQVTYKVYHRTNSGNGTNYTQWSGGTGVITAMEILA